MDAGGGRILDKAPPGTSEAFMLDTYPGNSLRFATLNGHLLYDCATESRQVALRGGGLQCVEEDPEALS